MKKIIVYFCIFLINFSPLSAFANSNTVSESKPVIRGYLVQFNHIKTKSDLTNLSKKTKHSISATLDKTSVAVVDPDITDISQTDIFNIERSIPDIKKIIPNYVRKLTSAPTLPNDPYFSNQYGLNNTGQYVSGLYGVADKDINAPEAWEISNGGSNTKVVAIIDTGVLLSHPDLRGSIWNGSLCKDSNGNFLGECNGGYDFADNDRDPNPNQNESLWYHGTFIAGIIAAQKNNNIGVAGIAPNVKIMAIRVSSNIPLSEEIDAINFARNNGAEVINASWGVSGLSVGDPNACSYAKFESSFIQQFPGLFVTSAGNDGALRDNETQTFSSPADLGHTVSGCFNAIDNVVSVASINSSGQLSSFSDRGQRVDIAAPGESIYSTTDETVVNTSSSYTTAYSQNFNGVYGGYVPGDWTHFGNSPGVRDSAVIGSKVLDMDLNYPLLNNNLTGVATPKINLENYTSASVNIDVACETEYWSSLWTDYLEVLVSNDGVNYISRGRLDSYVISQYSNYKYLYGYETKNIYASYYTDSIQLNLDYQYFNPNFKVKFVWNTDGSNSYYEGCAIDNFSVSGDKNYITTNNYKYKFGSGTSYSAPYVTAAAALVKSMNSNITPAEIKNLLINTGTSGNFGLSGPAKYLNLDNLLVNVVNPNHYIRIKGQDKIYLTYGQQYNDIGATYYENGYGEGALIGQGTINQYKPGKYTVTYSHEDHLGSVVSRSREVVVLPQGIDGDTFYKEIVGSIEISAIGGYPDGTFGSLNPIRRSEVAAILTRALGLSDEVITQDDINQYSFSDVSPNHWAYRNIIIARKHGLIGGRTLTIFDPEAYVTRAEIAAMIARRIPSYPGVLKVIFPDSVNHWAAQNIQQVSSYRIVNGFSSDVFGPNNNATRGQFAKILINTLFVLNHSS